MEAYVITFLIGVVLGLIMGVSLSRSAVLR